MDIVKHFYEYKVETFCGIQYIDILGTKEDWTLLASTLNDFLTFLELSKWNTELQTILSHFINSFDGTHDKEFWDKIYYYHGARGSGSTAKVSGWIAELFLYIKDEINPMLSPVNLPKRTEPRSEFKSTPWLDDELWSTNPKTKTLKKDRIDPSDFPIGYTSTPFVWEYYKETLDMKIMSGLVGITLGEDGALKPELGWVISHQ